MNHPSQAPSFNNIVKIEPPLHQGSTQITPKKESLLIKTQPPENRSTFHKSITFGTEVKLETIRKEKKKPKRPWTPEEDKILKELVENKGPKQWAYISSHFNDRCGKQCRQRWHNHLRNGIKKGDWSFDQEWLLFLGVHAYGKKWSIISKILQGRTENTLKNHWNCKMKPKKQSFFKKLNNILRSASNRLLTKCESNLIRLIKLKPYQEQENLLHDGNTQRIINLFQGVIKNFKAQKKLIYSLYQVQEKTEQVKIEEDSLSGQENIAGNFFTNQMTPKMEIAAKKKVKNSTTKNQISEQSQVFGIINDFGSDSNSFDAKINFVLKEVLQEENQIGQEMDSQNFYESDWIEEDEVKQSIDEGESEESDKFGSPLKRNIFAGMYFEQMNEKNRIFEDCESQEKKSK